jgi:uncharacterized protein YjiS (DUF1127 family)
LTIRQGSLPPTVRRPYCTNSRCGCVNAISEAAERAHLQMLDDHLLQDIGVTAAEAQAEAAKWPWTK